MQMHRAKDVGGSLSLSWVLGKNKFLQVRWLRVSLFQRFDPRSQGAWNPRHGKRRTRENQEGKIRLQSSIQMCEDGVRRVDRHPSATYLECSNNMLAGLSVAPRFAGTG